MRILLKSSFVDRLENQVIYIAKDSPSRARKFNMDVLKEVKNIHPNPYRFRKSTYFEDKTIRDLIFKGYTIVYKINEETIEVFGFVKYQEKLHDY
jgi:plasmid stabilization system protein ParE